MLHRIFIIFCIAIVLSFPIVVSSGPVAAGRVNFTEPGPSFSDWVLVDTHVEKKDVDIVARIYKNPKNKNQEGFTTSIKTISKGETLLLKVWGFERTSEGSVKDNGVQSALRLLSGDWFVGDSGEPPDVHMELGLHGYNLVIHVKKLDQRWYQKCLEDKKQNPKEDCEKFFYDKTHNGMYISIPVRKYDK